MTHEKLTPPPAQPGTYRHYRGGRYEVVGVACDSETLEWYVVYRPLYEHSGMPDIWVRPYEMFFEEVSVSGELVPRFQKVEEN